MWERPSVFVVQRKHLIKFTICSFRIKRLDSARGNATFVPVSDLSPNKHIGLHCLYTSFLGSCRCFQLLRMTLCFSASFVSPTTFFKITLFSKTVSISLSSFRIRSSVSPTLTCRRQQTIVCYIKVPFSAYTNNYSDKFGNGEPTTSRVSFFIVSIICSDGFAYLWDNSD